MIYILNVYPLEPSSSGNGLFNRGHKMFYLDDPVKVFEVMSQIPKDHYLSLSISDFSSVDDVLNYVKDGCCPVESFRD